MKVTNICRRLAASLAAAGLLAFTSARAADLNTNLVINPSFEAVDTGFPIGSYSALLVTDGWTTDFGGGIGAYDHAHIPDYANGADPTGAGAYYYTFPAAGTPARQTIDLSTGASASLIATGNAFFSAGSYFANYLAQGDFGRLTVTFKNSGGTTLGAPVVLNSSAGVSGGVLNWSQFATDGIIPVGTANATIELVGLRTGGSSAGNQYREGYFDLVDFRVVNQDPPVALKLTVDRGSGNLTIGTDGTGTPVNITEYLIESAFGALAPASWLSIADNYDAGNPGPNQVDSNSNWVEVTVPADRDNLNEEDSNPNGATLTVGRTINLGNSWIKNYDEDLVFRYTSGGNVLTGTVNYVGNSGQPFPFGDLSFNGSIGAEDYIILANNQFVDLTGKSSAEAYQLGDLTGNLQNNYADFAEFKTLYEAANGAGSFAAMLAGVPEPSSLSMLVVVGLFGLTIGRRSARG